VKSTYQRQVVFAQVRAAVDMALGAISAFTVRRGRSKRTVIIVGHVSGIVGHKLSMERIK